MEKINNNDMVSIIMPVYNGEAYIKRSIESVLSQSYEDIEVIIVDDGSIDNTAEIIKSYNDERIIYIRQKNQGQGAARNKGIKISAGKYIAFLDADDSYLSEKVEKEVNYLKEHPEFQCVYCNALHFYTNNRVKFYKKKGIFPSGDILNCLLESNFINPNTIMVRKDILEGKIMFGEGEEGRYCDDWGFYLKIAAAGYHFGYLNENLVKVEIRNDSHTQWDIQWKMKKNALEFIEKMCLQENNIKKNPSIVNSILLKLKLKLAVAYLIVNRKMDFYKIISKVYPPIVAYSISRIIFIIPAFLVRNVLIALWKWRQKKSFSLERIIQ